MIRLSEAYSVIEDIVDQYPYLTLTEGKTAQEALRIVHTAMSLYTPRPVKVILTKHNDDIKVNDTCPTCGRVLTMYKTLHCDRCGQSIDWNDERYDVERCIDRLEPKDKEAIRSDPFYEELKKFKETGLI